MIEVVWTQALAQGVPIERWFAHVERPTFTEAFAQIERGDGQWWLLVYPQWSVRHRPGFRGSRIRYDSPRAAKKHVEAWVQVCWPMLQRRWGIRTKPADEP